MNGNTVSLFLHGLTEYHGAPPVNTVTSKE